MQLDLNTERAKEQRLAAPGTTSEASYGLRAN